MSLRLAEYENRQPASVISRNPQIRGRRWRAAASAIAAREAMKVGSSSTKMASVGHARIDAKLGSKSSDPRASKLRKVNPSNPAVGSTSLMNIGCAGLPGFWRIVQREAAITARGHDFVPSAVLKDCFAEIFIHCDFETHLRKRDPQPQCLRRFPQEFRGR